MVPNPDGAVLRKVVTEGPGPALAGLEASVTRSALFDHEVRTLPMPELEEQLAGAGLPVRHRYGVRIANDLLVDDVAKADEAYFQALLRLELALCDREPFLRVGGPVPAGLGEVLIRPRPRPG